MRSAFVNQKKKMDFYSTVNVVFSKTCVAGSVAVMIVVPAAAAVARPFDPAVLLMVATPVLLELQVTVLVKSIGCEASANVPVALNCVVVPVEMMASIGSMAMDMTGKVVTVSMTWPEMLFAVSVAVMAVVLAVRAVTNPFEPVTLLTMAMLLSSELQVDAVVQFRVEPSEKIAVAVNGCGGKSAGMIALAGVTSMACSLPLRLQLMRPIATIKRTAVPKMKYFTTFIITCLLGLPHHA